MYQNVAYIWIYLVWFGKYCHYRRFTYYRLVTKLKKLEGTKILVDAKRFDVNWFGLVDIAIFSIAIFVCTEQRALVFGVFLIFSFVAQNKNVQ